MPSKFIKKTSLISLLIAFLCLFSACSFVEYKEAKLKVTNINEELSQASINKEEFLDMPELLDKAIRKGYNIAVFPIHEKWKDIGKPEDYYDAKDSNE